MFFSIGIESPKSDNDAYGIAVPALCVGHYGCFSAADSLADVTRCAQDAIRSILMCMVDDRFDIRGLVDAGTLVYQTHEDYAHCDTWLMVEVDLSGYLAG
ncbi:type II toxin-antitoxin system HicB family antitoxin [Photobacterium aphoticum]|uniref:type II toxin-antitoxin system HicB family antitoxin n=1 Tax=Photobacterium aphoticum TaxID=754436 RepID=UPI00069CCF54|nr:type II toxin-antitoxin system HicB family antitoxin [Photobacterium aphoticum]